MIVALMLIYLAGISLVVSSVCFAIHLVQIETETISNHKPVNDQFSAVLTQMADKDAPPPMMYDFHLAGMLPVAFITGKAGIFKRIFDMIAAYDIPPDSIRFSLAELCV